ncbi:MAG: hypothetical protein HOJ65_12480, partial [Verrucomicrobia bacterium]|nr:hypothetical protein [Verrucomicrobiota bacterium]
MKSIHLSKLGPVGLAGLAWALASTVTAENWPAWRGPAANGVAPGGNPPKEFSEGKNVLWKIKIPGSGNSTPVIWGDQLFVLTAEKTGEKVAATAGGESRERNQAGESRRPSGERSRPNGERGNERGRRSGFGSGSLNREDLLKRFDKDGDGELSDAERDALREEMRRQFGGERG